MAKAGVLGRSAKNAYLEALSRRQHDGVKTAGWRGSEHMVEVWMLAFEIGAEDNISPWDALLTGVRRRSARVRWCDAMVAAAIAQQRVDAEAENAGMPVAGELVPDDTVRVWLTESRNEERLLARTAKMAIDAGVAEAVIRRLQLEGRLVTEVLVAGLDAIDLTPEQRMKALTAVHGKLLELGDGRKRNSGGAAGAAEDSDTD